MSNFFATAWFCLMIVCVLDLFVAPERSFATVLMMIGLTAVGTFLFREAQKHE